MVKRLVSFLFLGIIFLFGFLQAQESTQSEKDIPMMVNSGEAQYDGKEIVLTGQVVVQHGLGQISAHRLSLLPSIQDKKNKFAFLKISDDVQIDLHGGGRLCCQQAEVDYAKMQAIFLGDKEKPDVTFHHTAESHESEEKKSSFEVKSLQMLVELEREQSLSNTPSKTLVKHLEANQNVRVQYNQDYLVLADHAFYQRLPTSENSSNVGILTLFADGDHPVCKMTNLNGDRVEAQKIQINTNERTIWLAKPNGMLEMNREEQPLQTLHCHANELIWDHQNQTLHLKGEIDITQNETFQVQSNHEMVIVQTTNNGKKILRSIQSPKETQISYLEALKGNTHRIYCPGPLIIDHEVHEITLRGLSNSLGEIEESQQVYIEDVLGEMYADSAHVKYSWTDRHFVPEKIVLEGHVRLLNRFDGHPEESGSVLHYALADRVDYLLKQQEITLDSPKGNRVLFFDKVNNVQMSAPSLKVKHDATTKKETIQGMGDVRFTFIEKELEQLKQRFRSSESSNLKGVGNAKSKK